MSNIYQTALEAKFDSIMATIAMELGYGNYLIGLTVERRDLVQNVAEQSILNWAVGRRGPNPPPIPITNLQHLLDEYCTLADHL